MSSIEETAPADWKKSTRSGGSNCVEVCLGDPVKIRDTKDQDGPEIPLTREAWQAFLDGVRDGEFDRHR
jgi:hypothetical protein